MKTEIITSHKGELSHCILEGSERIGSPAEFLDTLMSISSGTLLIDIDDLAGEFFDLRSDLAGEMLQKVSNYRKRLIVLGDFSRFHSKALRDFIYESNRTGKAVFAADLEAAIELLR
jgi:hypothetical protein